MMPRVLVIGATGTTGSRVSQRLVDRGVHTRQASRSGREGTVMFDWYQPETWPEALQGVDSLFLVAPIGDPEPAPVVKPFLELAVDGGLRRVVLLSSSAVEPGPAGLGALHELVTDLAPEWAVLRPSWFMQNFVGDLPAAAGIRSGRLATATGGGRVAFVDAGDIAESAVSLLLADTAPQSEFVLTGPEALTYADVCTIAAELRGAPVELEQITPTELAIRLTAAGIPEDFASILAALDQSISQGAEDRVTDAVNQLTGRPPTSMRQVLSAHVAQLR